MSDLVARPGFWQDAVDLELRRWVRRYGLSLTALAGRWIIR